MKLDYESKIFVNLTKAGDTCIVPADGILAIDWCSTTSDKGLVGIRSQMRSNNYIHIESRPAGWMYASGSYIVQKDDILTVDELEGTRYGVYLYFYPFKT